MTLYNQSDEYFKGFIVGSLTIFTIAAPILATISIIDYFPSFYRELSLIIFVFSLPFWLIKSIRKTEKFIRLKFEKENPRFNNPIIPCNNAVLSTSHEEAKQE